MSIATQIQRIQGLVDTLRTKIQNKGVALENDADLEDCVNAVDDIEGGGGTPTPSGYEGEYFTIENVTSSNKDVRIKFSYENSSNYFYFKSSIDYSFDKVTWTTYNLNATSSSYNALICTIPGNTKCYFRSTSRRVDFKYSSYASYVNYYYFNLAYANNAGWCNISGNIMSLFNGDNFINSNHVGPFEFAYLFTGCGGILNANNLVLPKNTAYSSHKRMFSGCTYLLSIPILDAPIAERYAYYQICGNCFTLTSAEILADVLRDYSCYSAFDGCSTLNSLKTLATTRDTTQATQYWLGGVASTGTFIKKSGTTFWYAGNNSGYPSGWTVQEV